MNKRLLILLVILTVVLSGCGVKTNNIVSDIDEYYGDFENQPVYQKIINIENCTIPEQMILELESIYGESISCIYLDYDEKAGIFNEPYEEFKFNVYSVYSSSKNKGEVSSDAYAFFLGYNESPLIIMDDEGSYLVGNYEVITLGENNYQHNVDAWALSDLYLCLHGYANCEGDSVRRKAYENIVKSMDFYLDFESRLHK